MADDKPVIIIKKGHGHAGHHGGAWKVAYADFVTAMMAFFMVMWLLSTADHHTKKEIARYFQQVGIFEQGSGSPLMMGESGIIFDAMKPPNPDENKTHRSGQSTDPREGRTEKEGGEDSTMKFKIREAGETEGFDKPEHPSDETVFRKGGPAPVQPEDDPDSQEVPKFQALREQIQILVKENPELQELLGIVDVRLDDDGLNLEIMDSDKSSMFARGSAIITSDARKAFAKIGELLKGLPNTVTITGHTDSAQFAGGIGAYSNWELSADRANAARRLLESVGIEKVRFTSVEGRADKELRVKDDPSNPQNRRITLKMRFFEPLKMKPGQRPVAPASTGPALTGQSLTGTPRPKPPVVNVSSADSKTSAVATPQVHSFTPKDILERQDKPSAPTRLPAASPSENPDFMPKDKIFGDSPVIGDVVTP